MDFPAAGMGFALERFAPERSTLAVAAFDGRAIRVHERLGFRRDGVSTHETNGGEHEYSSTGREA